MPPRQCCLRECFIISLAKALALQLPLLPRTIALAVHLLRLLCKQSLTWQVISVILFSPFYWQSDFICRLNQYHHRVVVICYS
nr:MAG TPA: hypothetical protein [Caudoviricetes sp.]